MPMERKEIRITGIEGIRIGQVENTDAKTGLTLMMAEDPGGFRAGLDISGGGPASRETPLLDPLTHAEKINGILIGGGSAFGLDAAGGVMEYMEEHGIGYDVGITKVPLVCQSDIFDLGVGDYRIRPDKAMGYAVCEAAMAGNYKDGPYGAGTGATVGKSQGMEHAKASGVGSYAIEMGDLKMGALVVVNSFGDIYDPKTSNLIAGPGTDISELGKAFGFNTTIGIIVTNAKFTKTGLCKIAKMAQDGFARCIRPVHTNLDGDSIYAVSVGDLEVDISFAGALGAEIMAEAILRAVK